MDETADRNRADDHLRLAGDIVAAFVSANSLPAAELPSLIRNVHQTLRGLDGEGSSAPAERPKPAVPVGRSVHPDYIVCLEDGAKLQMLKRYLRSRFNMTPEDYRRRWGLPADYPMVAPNYAARRSAVAKASGLGRGIRRR
ncbi:MAG: MucR family transcriptional regulator [Caulobacteraceae bacterium]|nr:MucR family transcriptional regulator [Caulobacteraceae bacterium]